MLYKSLIFYSILILLYPSPVSSFELNEFVINAIGNAHNFARNALEYYQEFNYTEKMTDIRETYADSKSIILQIKDEIVKALDKEELTVMYSFAETVGGGLETLLELGERFLSKFDQIISVCFGIYDKIDLKMNEINVEIFGKEAKARHISQEYRTLDNQIEKAILNIAKLSQLEQKQREIVVEKYAFDEKMIRLIKSRMELSEYFTFGEDDDESIIATALQEYKEKDGEEAREQENAEDDYWEYVEMIYKPFEAFSEYLKNLNENLDLQCVNQIFKNSKVFEKIAKMDNNRAEHEWNYVLDELQRISLQCSGNKEAILKVFGGVISKSYIEEKQYLIYSVLKYYDTLVQALRMKHDLILKKLMGFLNEKNKGRHNYDL